VKLDVVNRGGQRDRVAGIRTEAPGL
jgi:hypothetical protein